MLAQNGLSFDLSTSTGKLMRTTMGGLAEFEGDLIRDRVKSGLARPPLAPVASSSVGNTAAFRQEGQQTDWGRSK